MEITSFLPIRTLRIAAFVLLFLSPWGDAARADHSQRFADLYAESSWLARTQTVASLAHLRGGWRWPVARIETYAGLRLGSDTRTLLSKEDAIYNDNYIFPHAGIDWLPLGGLRIFTQIGYSFDLKESVQREGFDYRAGGLFYLETPLSKVVMENYSESIYVRRYRNLLTAHQLRFFLPLFWQGKIGPVAGVALQTDSAGFAYNRFAELRAGARLKAHLGGNFFVLVQPYYAGVRRYSGQTANYGEFRTLVALSGNF